MDGIIVVIFHLNPAQSFSIRTDTVIYQIRTSENTSANYGITLAKFNFITITSTSTDSSFFTKNSNNSDRKYIARIKVKKNLPD